VCFFRVVFSEVLTRGTFFHELSHSSDRDICVVREYVTNYLAGILNPSCNFVGASKVDYTDSSHCIVLEPLIVLYHMLHLTDACQSKSSFDITLVELLVFGERHLLKL